MAFYSDKVVYIFGGSSGIGLASACQLTTLGAQVHLFARRERNLAAACKQIDQHNRKTTAYSCADVQDEQQTRDAVEQAVAATGEPHIVINCAGAARPNYFENISAEQFKHTLILNVLGARNIASACLPYLKQTQGQLINTSSIAGFIGVFGYTDYCASKFAVVGFSEALQQEVKQYGVSISVLYPPDTLTEGFAEEEKTKPPETRAISAGNKPMSPAQVAQALVKALPKRRFHILPGLDNRLAHVLKRWCPWLVSWVMDRAVRKVQRG